MKKRKSFDEELWHLFQDARVAGKELVDSIEKANYKKIGVPTTSAPAAATNLSP